MSKRRAWTQEEEQKLAEMYEGGTPTSVMAKILGRTPGSVDGKVAHLKLSDPMKKQAASRGQDRTQLAYVAGRERRRRGGSKVPPGDMEFVLRAFWFAGWHDKDMELGKRVIKRGAA